MLDLHMHTTRSDGQFSPAETITMAHDAGVTVAAITDHDTVAGIQEGEETAAKYGMRFFPGIELSVQGDREIHILGYGVDRTNEALLAFCKEQSDNRKKRVGRMLTYLQDLGVEITLDDVKASNNGKTTGRVHFARTLVDKGYATSISDAFDKYLTTPEYYAKAERPKPTPADGIAAIRNAGGVAVLAHPYQLHLEPTPFCALLEQLMEYGLSGIEAYYSRHTPEQTQFYLGVAEKYHLLITCGSDFHGPDVKPDIQLGTGVHGSLGICDASIPDNLATAIHNMQKNS